MASAHHPALVKAFRFVAPIIDPRKTWRGLREYPRFFLEVFRYRRMMKAAQRKERWELYPSLHERTSTSSFDAHYCYMGFWATQRLAERPGDDHIDVASQISWVMNVAATRRVRFVDIRPFETYLPTLTVEAGTVLALPFADKSLSSVSCLHVVEHVGLGRYGDPMDPLGSEKAIIELARVLAPGGRLLFAVPVGRERVCFNAHRMLAPKTVIDLFAAEGLRLSSFAGVSDDREYRDGIAPEIFANADFALGLFEFVR